MSLCQGCVSKSVNWLLLLVISLPLWQTSCPLRTFHLYMPFRISNGCSQWRIVWIWLFNHLVSGDEYWYLHSREWSRGWTVVYWSPVTTLHFIRSPVRVGTLAHSPGNSYWNKIMCSTRIYCFSKLKFHCLAKELARRKNCLLSVFPSVHVCLVWYFLFTINGDHCLCRFPCNYKSTPLPDKLSAEDRSFFLVFTKKKMKISYTNT